MFKKVILDNFLSFKHLEFDLSISRNRPKSFALIYGENGSGKSNLISSFLFLKESLSTLSAEKFLERLKTETSGEDLVLNSEVLEKNELMRLSYILRRSSGDLKKMAQSNRLISSEEGIHVYYEFFLDNKTGYYELIFNAKNQLTREKLRYTGDERITTLFEISRDYESPENQITKKMSSKLFSSQGYKKEIGVIIDQLWGKHTFGAILFDELEKKNADYIESNVSSNVNRVLKFFEKFTIQCDCKPFESVGVGSVSKKMFTQLRKGTIPSEEKHDLMICEEALNNFFCRLYSDIKRVYYSQEVADQQINYKLVFSKMIGGKVRDIPADCESTGTIKLLEHFPALFEAVGGKTVVIDEIDSGIHDVLMKEILLDVSEALTGQLIVSTHNTMLIEEISPESVYILDIDVDGNKKIAPISDLARTYVNNNNQARYLSGAFGGVPSTASLAFSEIVAYSIEQFEADDSC